MPLGAYSFQLVAVGVGPVWPGSRRRRTSNEPSSWRRGEARKRERERRPCLFNPTNALPRRPPHSKVQKRGKEGGRRARNESHPPRPPPTALKCAPFFFRVKPSGCLIAPRSKLLLQKASCSFAPPRAVGWLLARSLALAGRRRLLS